ncbi:DUF177 domain-containing protein [Brevundimonas sp.]|jgi:uncharacterized metal-binding protein YceD (DUF177 family)|uniref:YceD family protein n=1 Tax=Brevundimonas sp. TaxID=1871086 RepID=UPI002E10F25C|nr:DUF177 domain-containing protein [Brevundimonas sp.]
MSDAPPLSEPIRLNQIGAGLTRRLEPDEAQRRAVARWLDLQSLDAFVAEMTVAPAPVGWTLSGRITAEAVQSCGLTLAPVPARIDQMFRIALVEAGENEASEVEVFLEDDAPDLIEDGRIDLGHHSVEQLSLALDPFPRAPGAEFTPPEESAEISPFAVLKALKRDGDGA